MEDDRIWRHQSRITPEEKQKKRLKLFLQTMARANIKVPVRKF